MNDVTVCIPSIPPRHRQLAAALESVARQDRPPDAVAVAHDLDAAGAATTRNRAAAMARTEWVAFLDDDDTLHPQHLDRLLAHQADTGADLVYPWFDLIHLGTLRNDLDPLGAFGRPFDPAELASRNFIPVTYLVRRELVEAVGGFPVCGSEAWPMDDCEDWGFLQAVVAAGATFSHLPERTWSWHHWGGNLSGKPWRAPRTVGSAA